VLIGTGADVAADLVAGRRIDHEPAGADERAGRVEGDVRELGHGADPSALVA
jgi:hypothetical protein